MRRRRSLFACCREPREQPTCGALIVVFTAWRRGQLASDGPPGDLTRAQRKAINLRAWALASEETRTAFQKHQARLLREARDLLVSGRPIETLLENKETPE